MKLLYFFILMILCSCSSKVEFIPIVRENQRLVEKHILMDVYFRERILNVLNHYKIDYEIENNRIMIDRSISRELIWNYTTKANDSVWLKERNYPTSFSKLKIINY